MFTYKLQENTQFVLKSIKRWSNAFWYVKIQLNKSFTLINQKILIIFLKQVIIDKRLINYLQKNFIKNTLKFKKFLKENSLTETLFNIYLHTFDTFITNHVRLECQKGFKFILNLKYYDFLKAVTKKNKKRFFYKILLKTLIRKNILFSLVSYKVNNNVKYIRYFNQFLLAARGSKVLILTILKKINFFLTFKLCLLIKK